ncbi:TatD family hydrolase, partial [Pseudomonas viridiflava]|uniref:TatD family hydrolase n=1 Tax=Pseudomonas viridiflava TaxID=33069 RepID=UPI001F150AA6
MDWRRQIEIGRQHPEIQVVFGLHPYEVHKAFEARDENACENALDELARLVVHAPLLGETGLDLRPQFASSVG